MTDAYAINGLEQLKSGLRKRANKTALRQIMKLNASEMQKKTSDLATQKFTGHYEGKKFVRPTGRTRGSLKITAISPDSLQLSYGTEYAYYLEYGTRYMSARPTMGPAFAIQKVQFVKDLKAVMG